MSDAPIDTHFILAESASTVSPRIDVLMGSLTALCGAVSLGVALTIVVLAVRYRANARVDRRQPPPNKVGIEIAWTLIPLLIFLGLFGWAASGFIDLYRVPANALPIYVVGKQWMWKLQHRNGRQEINTLHVPVGQPIELILSSQDVIHSFFIPAFRVKQDVVPGRYTKLWFEPTRTGDYRLFCSEYCGTAHADMIGHVVVMTQPDYARWLGEDLQQPSLARQGEQRFKALGCSGCHGTGEAGGAVPAPNLQGLIGRTVHLQDGRSLIADENYVRDAILLPAKDVVAGYKPLMPSFAGQVTEEDLVALIAYIGTPSTPVPAAATDAQGPSP
ncbi:MAG: cytochrome c oxidase subunit II [Aquabacterium sp.]